MVSVQHQSSKRSIDVVDQGFEAIHGLGIMEEPNKTRDKDSAEEELNKRKINMLD